MRGESNEMALMDNWTTSDDEGWVNFMHITKQITVTWGERSRLRSHKGEAGDEWKLEEPYLRPSWRRGGRAGRYPAETDYGCAEPASAELWECASRAGHLPSGWEEPVRVAGRGLRQGADVAVWSSLPSAAPWFYWSRLGYPADSQETTFVTGEHSSVQSVALYVAWVPSNGCYMTLYP